MTTTRVLRLCVLALLSVVLVLLTAIAPASAFKLPIHEQVVRAGVAPFGPSSGAVTGILGSFVSGQGNLGSDRYQFNADHRHFDNATSPGDICARATTAWNEFYGAMRTSMTPVGAPEYTSVASVDAARSALGALTHSLQDFYSHSNWIEIYAARGQSPPLADMIFPTCSAGLLPPDIQTGFFNLRLGAADGCPNAGPPAPFRFCHETLNKDDSASLEGRKIIPGTTLTFHQVAAQIATAHTTQLYQTVLDSLRRDVGADRPAARADCVIAHVVNDSTEPCRYGRITLSNPASSVQLGEGTVTLVSATGAIAETVQIPRWPSSPIQTRSCLKGMTAQWDFAVQDRYPVPGGPRHVRSQQAISTGTCDGSVSIDPRASLEYLVRFTDTDTRIPLYTNVTAVVNLGQRVVPAGPVFAGATIWVSLGPCAGVATYDFTIQFAEPGTGIPRTAEPDPPPFTAQQTCEDDLVFGDLGGALYP